MPDRYISTSRPLTPYEGEVLTCLAEECAEVIQAVTKILRFGPDDHYDNGETGTEVLARELGDLHQVMRFLDSLSFTKTARWSATLQEGYIKKKSKLEKYLQHRMDSNNA